MSPFRKRVEKEKIRTDLRRCGYPNWALQGQKKDKKTKTIAQREQQGEKKRSKMHVVLPYIQRMMERVQQMFRKHDIALHSNPRCTLRQALKATKDKVSSDETQGVIYQ